MPPFEIKSIGDYGNGIRAAIRGLWTDTFDLAQFYDSMLNTVERGLTRAWYDGAAECDIKPGELTLDELSRMREEINNDLLYVSGLANAVVSGSKINGGKLGPLLTRSQHWTNRYYAVRDIAKTMACADQKFLWQIDAPKESCPSCKKLDGKVKRGSVWAAANVYPKSWDMLECGGGCKCGLIKTDLPVTPGPLPALP